MANSTTFKLALRTDGTRTVINETNRVQSQIKGMDGVAGKMRNTFISLQSALAGLVGVGGLAALYRVMKDINMAAAEWEKRGMRTEALIKATGSAAGLSKKELLDFAEAQDLATLGNRNDILDSSNILLTFRSVHGQIFKEAIQLSQDLSTVFGTGLRSATTMLGKALEDPVQGLTSLRRTGVMFTDDQEKMIKSMVAAGDAAKAQALIIAELRKQVGGAAGAEAQGLTGAVDALDYHWIKLKDDMADTKTAADGVDLITRAIIALRKELNPAARSSEELLDRINQIRDAELQGVQLNDYQKADLQRLQQAYVEKNPVDQNELSALKRAAGENFAPAANTIPQPAYVENQNKASSSPSPVSPDSQFYGDAGTANYGMYSIFGGMAADESLGYSLGDDSEGGLMPADQYRLDSATMLLEGLQEIEADAYVMYSDSYQRLTALDQEAAANREQIARAEASARQSTMNFLMNGLASMANSGNKKLFNIQKAVRIPLAIMDTYGAINNALASMPYPYNLAAAAMVGAMGFANVASIASTSFGSTSAATATVSGTTGGYAMNTSGSTATDAATEAETKERAPTVNLTIHTGATVLDEATMYELVEKLSPSIEKAVGDGKLQLAMA